MYYGGDKKLSLKAKWLLATVGRGVKRFDDFKGLSKNGRDSTRDAIKELIKQGYCEMSVIKDGKGRYEDVLYNFIEIKK